MDSFWVGAFSRGDGHRDKSCNGIEVRLSKDSSVRDPMMGVNSCLPGAYGTCGESVLAFFRNVPQQTPKQHRFSSSPPPPV